MRLIFAIGKNLSCSRTSSPAGLPEVLEVVVAPAVAVGASFFSVRGNGCHGVAMFDKLCLPCILTIMVVAIEGLEDGAPFLPTTDDDDDMWC